MNKIGIVVLSYNQIEASHYCIDSLRIHTPVGRYKVYWVDNGSSDGTRYLIDTYIAQGKIDISVNYQKTNSGVIGGRNLGFEWFINQEKDLTHLMFLDNDQYVKKGWLSQYNDFMSDKYDLCGLEAWRMDKTFFPYRCKVKTEPFTYVSCCGMMMRRYVAEELKSFDEQFNPAYFEDPDFCFRALDKNFRIGWNNNAEIVHESHTTLGNSKDKRKNFLNSFVKFKKKWDGRIIEPLCQE